jgi:hypothetical protein
MLDKPFLLEFQGYLDSLVAETVYRIDTQQVSARLADNMIRGILISLADRLQSLGVLPACPNCGTQRHEQEEGLQVRNQ